MHHGEENPMKPTEYNLKQNPIGIHILMSKIIKKNFTLKRKKNVHRKSVPEFSTKFSTYVKTNFDTDKLSGYSDQTDLQCSARTCGVVTWFGHKTVSYDRNYVATIYYLCVSSECPFR